MVLSVHQWKETVQMSAYFRAQCSAPTRGLDLGQVVSRVWATCLFLDSGFELILNRGQVSTNDVFLQTSLSVVFLFGGWSKPYSDELAENRPDYWKDAWKDHKEISGPHLMIWTEKRGQPSWPPGCLDAFSESQNFYGSSNIVIAEICTNLSSKCQ